MEALVLYAKHVEALREAPLRKTRVRRGLNRSAA